MWKYMEFIPGDLKEDLIKHNVLPFLGAGFSKNAEIPADMDMPDWKELGEYVAARMPGFENKNVIDTLSKYEEKYSHGQLCDLIQQCLHIEDERVRPGFVHENFSQIYFEHIFTTNFDYLLEQSLANAGWEVDKILFSRKYKGFGEGDIKLYKIHGDFDDTGTMILTQPDYDKIKNNEIINTVIKSKFIENTVLMIGYSCQDPHIQADWKKTREWMEGNGKKVYCILVGAKAEEIKKFEDMDISVVNLPGTDYKLVLELFFKELKDFLKESNHEALRKTRMVNDHSIDNGNRRFMENGKNYFLLINRKPVKIENNIFTIGRADCSHTIANETVSRWHAHIFINDKYGRAEIHDHSTNGTKINGDQIHGQMRILKDGDQIEIGSETLTFCVKDLDHPKGSPKKAGHIVKCNLIRVVVIIIIVLVSCVFFRYKQPGRVAGEKIQLCEDFFAAEDFGDNPSSGKYTRRADEDSYEDSLNYLSDPQFKGLKELDANPSIPYTESWVGYSHSINDLSGIQHVADTLEKLYLPYIQDVKSIKKLSKLKKLKVLDLSHNSSVVSFEPLKEMPLLESLNLADTRKQTIGQCAEDEHVYIDRIGVITEIPALKMLKLSQNDLKNIDFLCELKGVQVLDLSDNEIENLMPVSRLSALRWLDVSNNKIQSHEFLHGMHLQALRLDNDMALKNCSDIADMKELEELSVSGCVNLSNISDLQELPNLKKLDVSNGLLADFSVLKSLKGLEELRVNGTLFSDVTLLFDMKNLKKIEIKNTKIPKKDIQELEKELPDCIIVDL